MLDIPFPLETVPADQAETALQDLIDDYSGVTPVLLGDRDVFSTEWAEYVDVFENPAAIVAEARALDADRWFANRRKKRDTKTVEFGLPQKMRAGIAQLAKLPSGLASLVAHKRDVPVAPDTVRGSETLVDTLKAQLAELEAAGEGTAAELAEFREVISGIEADGAEDVFPDPVDYVTPRRGNAMAAGLVHADEPWESAAWLQHGTYAFCAPKAVFVAHCRWLWTTHGARLITASTDHIGFQMERPIASLFDAGEVMRRFELLGATEINGDRITSHGVSLVNAPRLWVWWD